MKAVLEMQLYFKKRWDTFFKKSLKSWKNSNKKELALFS